MSRKYKNKIVSCRPEHVRVAFGKNTVLDHPEPTNKQLQSDEVGYLDISGSYDGYHSFLSDSFFNGSVDGVKEAYDALNTVINKAVELMVPGAKGSEVYYNVSQILNEKYMKKSYFMGSPIGLEIHEPPIPNKHWIQPPIFGESEIQLNSVYCLIAGIHDLDKGWGIRLSETVLVTKPECKILT